MENKEDLEAGGLADSQSQSQLQSAQQSMIRNTVTLVDPADKRSVSKQSIHG